MGVSLSETGSKVREIKVTMDTESELERAKVEAERTNSMTPVIKLELKYSIEARRNKLGLGNIQIDNTAKPSYPLTEEEIKKKEKRTRSNCISAKKSRKQKKLKYTQIAEERTELQNRNKELKHLFRKLTDEKTTHLQLLKDKGCCIEQIHYILEHCVGATSGAVVGHTSPEMRQMMSTSSDSQTSLSSMSDTTSADMNGDLPIFSTEYTSDLENSAVPIFTFTDNQSLSSFIPESPAVGETFVLEKQSVAMCDELTDLLLSNGMSVNIHNSVDQTSDIQTGCVHAYSCEPYSSSNTNLPVFQGLLSTGFDADFDLTE